MYISQVYCQTVLTYKNLSTRVQQLHNLVLIYARHKWKICVLITKRLYENCRISFSICISFHYTFVRYYPWFEFSKIRKIDLRTYAYFPCGLFLQLYHHFEWDSCDICTHIHQTACTDTFVITGIPWCNLNHLPQNKMAVISRTALSNALWWLTSFVFDSNFIEVCF